MLSIIKREEVGDGLFSSRTLPERRVVLPMIDSGEVGHGKNPPVPWRESISDRPDCPSADGIAGRGSVIIPPSPGPASYGMIVPLARAVEGRLEDNASRAISVDCDRNNRPFGSDATCDPPGLGPFPQREVPCPSRGSMWHARLRLA